MSEADHICEPEEVCDGIIVTLHFDAVQRVCPQYAERKLRELLQHHAEAIAVHMASAGLDAATRLFNGREEAS